MTETSTSDCLVGCATKYVVNLSNFIPRNISGINNRTLHEIVENNTPNTSEFTRFFWLFFA